MANCNTQQLNITCGTDVVLHDRLIFEGETFDPNLSVGIAANLVSSLGKRTALDVQVVDDELLISVPWIDGTLPGCYGLEVTGSCNSKKWSTCADSLIKYTKATRIGVSEVTVESDSYDITQEVGYCYSNTPVTFAEVTVDDGYGTPSVDVEYEQRVLSMAFHNLKGNGITDIDVDEQVGDEAVNTVTIKTDADQEGAEFKVRNGRRGNGIASSSEVLSDQDGGTNMFTITDDDGTVHEFHSKNGTKGSQGDSAVYNPSDPDAPDFVMANTTGQSTTKAMTQKAVTDEFEADRLWEEASFDFNNGTNVFSGYINVSSKGIPYWASAGTNTNSGYMLEVYFQAGTKVHVVPQEGVPCEIEFLKTNYYASNADITDEQLAAPYMGFSSAERMLVVPEGCHYMYVSRRRSSADRLPAYIGFQIPTKKELDERTTSNKERTEWEEEVYDDISEFTIVNRCINASGVWATGSENNNCVLIPVELDEDLSIEVTAQINKSANFQLLGANSSSSTDYTNGSFIEWFSGTKVMEVPKRTKAIYVRNMTNGQNRFPEKIRLIKTVKAEINKIKEVVGDLNGNISEEIASKANYGLEAIGLPTSSAGVGLKFINSNNVWASNSSSNSGIVIAVEPCATYKVVPAEGYGFGYAWLNGNDRTNGNTPQYAEGCGLVYSGSANGTIYITAPEDANYLYYIRKSTNYIAPSYFGKEIAGISTNSKELSLVRHAYFKNEDSTAPRFTLLHYSDIHSSSQAARCILQSIKKYKHYLNDVLFTGDAPFSVFDGTTYGGTTWWQGCGLAEKSLMTLGNHDDLISTSSGERKDKAWSHENYFTSSLISTLGYVMPEGYDDSTSPNYNACYWHKDYPSQKVRLIGLDCRNLFDGVVNPATGEITSAGTNYMTNEQEVWLVERLAETLEGSGDVAAGYHVIIAGHYPLDDFSGDNKEWDDDAHEWICNHNSTGGRVIDHKTNSVTNWNRCSYTALSNNSAMRWANSNGDNNIGEIIKYYMEQEGSHFVVFLCGHMHNNLFFYPTKYPNILNVSIDQAGNLRNLYYADNGVEGYIANFLSFAPTSGLMRIVRLGVKSDVYLTPINYLCYDYINKKVISEG